MVNLPDYTQITLTDQNLLPLEDLGASAGYNRSLLLPDDLPGVIALPWAIGPTRPRVNQCQADGSLNVFMTGSSGGGGTTLAPLRPIAADGPSDILLSFGTDGTLIADIDSTRLLAYVHVTALVDTDGSVAVGSGFFQIRFQSGQTGAILGLASIKLAVGPTSAPTLLAGEFFLSPPGGLDLTGAGFGGGKVDLVGVLTATFTAAVRASGTVSYLT